MKFFDPKEEVLDIQLTKYGRHAMSQGIWKPVYYAFFDENVLYDASYVGTTENKNNVESRIQEETPSLRTQTMFTGREEYLFDGANDIVDRTRLGTYEKLTVMPFSLGTSTLDSTKTPAFKLRFLEGKVENLENSLTGTLRSDSTYSQQLLKIPQIESDIEFKITVAEEGRTPVRFEIDPALTPGRIYTDGTEVLIGPSQILLIVEEENASFDYQNFDIEVFEVTSETGASGETILEPMSFRKPLEMVENNLLIDREEAMQKAGRAKGELPPLDSTYVEYYFDINVDDEIDQNLICKSISKLRSTDLFNDLEIDCPDILTPIRSDIYSSDALDEDCPDY